jgi:hypothetical protein
LSLQPASEYSPPVAEHTVAVIAPFGTKPGAQLPLAVTAKFLMALLVSTRPRYTAVIAVGGETHSDSLHTSGVVRSGVHESLEGVEDVTSHTT